MELSGCESTIGFTRGELGSISFDPQVLTSGAAFALGEETKGLLERTVW
jgi:hypothetical protein